MSRRLAIATVLLGGATLACMAAFAVLPAQQAAAAQNCPGLESLAQFQTARSLSHLSALFGAAESACHAATRAAFAQIDRFDLFVFIPVYGAFLIAATFLVAEGCRLWALWIALAFIAVGLGGDIAETWAQARIGDDLATARAHLPLLMFGNLYKTGALCVHGAAMAALAFRRRAFMLALVSLLAPIGWLAPAADRLSDARFALLGISALWLGLFVFAIARVMRPSPAATPPA